METHSLENVNVHVESEHLLITGLKVLLNFIYILLYKKKTSATEAEIVETTFLFPKFWTVP